MATETMIEVDGRSYDAETVSGALLDVLLERAPVSIMSEMDVRDAILARLRWACGTLSLISTHCESGEDVKEAASAAELHVEQALTMCRALFEQSEPARALNHAEPEHADTPEESGAA